MDTLPVGSYSDNATADFNNDVAESDEGNNTTITGLYPVIAHTVFTVNSTDDVSDGTCDATHCSLREAIIAANNNIGTDQIAFSIAGAGPHVI